MAFSTGASAAGLRTGGAGFVRVGVTGREGVVVDAGLGGAGTFSGGGVAVVSGAIVVNGFESATVGAGAAATGAAAFTVLLVQPFIPLASAQIQITAKYRGVIRGLGLPLLLREWLTKVPNFCRRRFERARQRQFQAKRGAASDF